MILFLARLVFFYLLCKQNAVIMGYFSNAPFILVLYVISILYYAMMGCYMLTRQGNPISTHGELLAKQRMTRSAGFFMFFWALDLLIYLPAMLIDNNFYSKDNNICFLLTLMMETPMLYVVMHAIVQRTVNTLRWVCATGLPFLLLAIWYSLLPYGPESNFLLYMGAGLNIVYIIFLLIRYAHEYRIYVSRIQSEYSETSGREIFWAWWCFAGFALQSILFLLYNYFWEPVLDVFYWALSLFNAAFLCYCTCRQKPLDCDIVEVVANDIPEEKNEEKAFYAVIEQKLESLCEEKMLFLEPDLTRETLCLRLGIGRTYLSMYFRSRRITFYQYINTLRVEYAIKQMQENPQMSIREVSELSGFRSQTTFRKVFHEVMGCLPSELKTPGNTQI